MFSLYDEAEKISVFGLEVYRFGFFVMLGMALAAGMIAFLSWARRARKGTGPLLLFSSILLGALFSRLFFCVMSVEDFGALLPLRDWFRITGGGWSMTGLIAGVMLAAWLTARITRQKAGLLLDIASCALLPLIVMERVGEGSVPEFDYSRRLTTTFLNDTFLTFSDYDGFYLATWKLAAIVTAILIPILICDLTRSRKDGDTCLLFLLLFGGCSVLLESLRYDHFLTVHSFVGLQHVSAAVMIAIGVFVLAGRAGKRHRALAVAAIVSVLAMVGIAVGLEFALARTSFSKVLIYAAYILTVAVPVALGLALRRAVSAKAYPAG